jgi:hypothetical protein
MKMYGAMGALLHTFLTSELDGGGTHWVGGWGGGQSSSECSSEEKKIPFPPGNRTQLIQFTKQLYFFYVSAQLVKTVRIHDEET